MISNSSAYFFRKKKIFFNESVHNLKSILRKNHIHTVCEEARCPNISECFTKKTATFLVMGDICTRNCRFCSVKTGIPQPLNYNEIDYIINSIKKINLDYVVITSVTRDDLEDGGADFLSKLAFAIKEKTNSKIEFLFPDFKGNKNSLDKLIDSPIDIYNHNIEMTESLFSKIRPQGSYKTSLEILKYLYSKKVITKTGFMIGLGETKKEILKLIEDIKNAGVHILTIGQYIQPTLKNVKVEKYYNEEDFEELKKYAEDIGIPYVVSGPFVRSSYNAKEIFEELTKNK